MLNQVFKKFYWRLIKKEKLSFIHSYKPKTKFAKTKSLIYKNEFILNLRYKLKVYKRGFYLNGLNGLD